MNSVAEIDPVTVAPTLVVSNFLEPFHQSSADPPELNTAKLSLVGFLI